MEAIEFQTTLGQDGVITIPERFDQKVRRGKVRVIVIEEDPRSVAQSAESDEDRESVRNYIRYLMENPFQVDPSVPLLTRDEIYDRKL